jgi:hypothetical protein
MKKLRWTLKLKPLTSNIRSNNLIPKVGDLISAIYRPATILKIENPLRIHVWRRHKSPILWSMTNWGCCFHGFNSAVNFHFFWCGAESGAADLLAPPYEDWRIHGISRLQMLTTRRELWIHLVVSQNKDTYNVSNCIKNNCLNDPPNLSLSFQ